MTDLAYAAGVIDSDGWIGVSVRGNSYAPRVQVRQVTAPAVDLLGEMFGGYRAVVPPSAPGGRPLNQWAVHSAAAGRVCEAVGPYLRIKPRQAANAVEVCRINATAGSRRFEFPPVVEGEPMITMAEAARRLGKDYGVVLQSVRYGNVPHVRQGPRRVLIPESYLPVWAARGGRPKRSAEVTAQLERCLALARELNRVGQDAP
jgi:hypothetical protein